MGIVFINKAVLLQGYSTGFEWLQTPLPPQEGLQSALNVKTWVCFRVKQEQETEHKGLSHVHHVHALSGSPTLPLLLTLPATVSS